MIYSSNQFVDPFSGPQPQQGNKLIKTIYIGLIVLLYIAVLYFAAAKFLTLWPFQTEKQENVLTKKGYEETPSFIYFKKEGDAVSLELYNKGSVSRISDQLPLSLRNVLISPDRSRAIILNKEGFLQITSGEKSKREILNLKEKLKYNKDLSIDSSLFSPDGKRIVYFVNFNYEDKRELRIFDINSGEDKLLIEVNKETLDNLNKKYSVDLDTKDNFEPLFWFRDNYGEKVVFAHKGLLFSDALSIEPFFGFWIYDFQKRSISPIKVYDNQGNLLSIDCIDVGYKNYNKISEFKCDLFSLISKSHDGRYVLVSQKPMFPELSDTSNEPRRLLANQAEKEKLFVLDLSALANNKENNLKNGIISLPKCVLSELKSYFWSPDNKKIICNETKIEKTNALFFFYDLIYSVFNKKEIKKSYKVEYINYLIDIDSKTKSMVSQSSKTITFPDEFIQSIKDTAESKYGGNPERLYAFFVWFLETQNEIVIGVLPNNQFVISRPASSDGSRRQLIVSDLKGGESVIDEAVGDFPYFQFLGWIK